MTVDRRHPLLELEPERIAAMVDEVCPGADVVSSERVTGGRCNTNFRVRLRARRGSVLLRVYARGADVAAKELALCRRLIGVVPVPEARSDRVVTDDLGRPFALFEWVELPPLEAALAGADDVTAGAFGRSAGSHLARIESVRFDRQGDLDGGLNVRPWDMPGDGSLAGYVTACLALEPVTRRLGARRCDSLASLVAREGWRLEEASGLPALVHADFNPTNMLAGGAGSGAHVGCVLDWEFAHAGTTMMDFGNLLRVHRKLPGAFVDGFLSGYQSLAGPLPRDWRARSLLIDLTAHLEFLTSEADRGEIHRTALATIDDTLDRWADCLPAC